MGPCQSCTCFFWYWTPGLDQTRSSKVILGQDCSSESISSHCCNGIHFPSNNIRSFNATKIRNKLKQKKFESFWKKISHFPGRSTKCPIFEPRLDQTTGRTWGQVVHQICTINTKPHHWWFCLYTTECDKIDEEEAKKADEAENINCDNLDVYDTTISISIHCFPKEQYFPAQVEFVKEWIVNSKKNVYIRRYSPAIDLDRI